MVGPWIYVAADKFPDRDSTKIADQVLEPEKKNNNQVFNKETNDF